MPSGSDQTTAAALKLLDAVWADMREDIWVKRSLGVPVDRLPDLSEAAVVERSSHAAELLRQLDAVDPDALPGELALSLRMVRSSLERKAKEGEWYWTVFDPLGVGFFAMFAATAYGGGFLLQSIGGMIAQFRFESEGDLDRYLGVVEDYARLIDQMRERTAGQAERGMFMPRPQLEQSIELSRRLRASAAAGLQPASERLALVGSNAAADAIARRIEARVLPAFDRLIAWLERDETRAAAPESIGLSQFPNGPEIYAELVRQHTNLDLTPQQVHDRGLARMEKIRTAMEALVREVGFDGTPTQYWASLADDPSWRASDAEGIGAVFTRYIDRIAPHIDDYFRFRPEAPHGVEPLPAALSGSMTFGYYDTPGPGQPSGRYLFNVDNLAGGSLAHIAALNYHELVPGHHFHFASQRENAWLHPVRANAFVNAFNEGWAEYSARLAGEMGMYELPAERFGRLVMDAFLTNRLVVDTGMNALGWSLEQARDYMRDNSFMPETEIRSESIRYSCDIPGQSLAYKLGEDFLVECRDEMRAALGERFDIRDFHDAVLAPGALPLPLVAENVAVATRAIAEAPAA